MDLTEAGHQDTLIPRIQENDEIDISGTRWVLIIEKEVCIFRKLPQSRCLINKFQAVFHRLARHNYHMTALVGKGILITVSLKVPGPCRNAQMIDHKVREKDIRTSARAHSSDGSSISHPMTIGDRRPFMYWLTEIPMV